MSAPVFRVTEMFDRGSDWPWRFRVERFEPAGRFLWFNIEARWRPVTDWTKLETCRAVIANGGEMTRQVKR